MSTTEPTRSRSSDSIAGYLAAMSIFICLIGLAWHPLRLILPGIVVAMVAAGMGDGTSGSPSRPCSSPLPAFSSG